MSLFIPVRRRGRAAASLVCCALGVSLVAGAGVAGGQPSESRCTVAAGGPDRLLPPVDAVVSAAFSLPDGPYGRGNRGLEYETVEGQPVRAAAAGTVSFAGVIAGERYVSVRHRADLVTSYSYLGTIEVAVGEAVARGQHLGTASQRFQLGVRRSGTYVDPAPLLGSERLRPRLVAVGEVPLTCSSAQGMRATAVLVR